MNRLEKGSILLAAAVTLIGCGAFTAEAQDPPRENKGLKAIELRSIDLTSEIDSVQGRRLRLMINLKTAKALGLEFHPQLLATADEVIE